MLLRRRVHASWKVTLFAALIGGYTLAVGGLIPTAWVWGVTFIVLVARPIAELVFSGKCYCPHCEADLFLEACTVENTHGIEQGLRCPVCGEDAAQVSALKGQVIDVDEVG